MQGAKFAQEKYLDKKLKTGFVDLTVEKQGKEKKIRVFKYKAKANEHKTIGHRQPYTCLVIEAING